MVVLLGCVSLRAQQTELSAAGIEAKFGKDILEKVRKDADKEYESKGYEEKARQFHQKFKDAVQSLPKKDN